MHLQYVKKHLAAIKADLADKYHIRSMGLFGSVVRDDYKPESDIDILVEFTMPVGVEFIDLANEIEKRLQKKVDLVSKNGIKAEYLKSIEQEVVYV